MKHFFKSIVTSLLSLAAFAFTACGNSDDNNVPTGPTTDPTLAVSTTELTLEAVNGAAKTFSITANVAWEATTTGTGFSISQQTGSGDATITVTATSANPDSQEKALGTIVVAAPDGGTAGSQTIHIRQHGTPADPGPEGDVTITLDFAEGPAIATPQLPGKSADALSGRHTYTMAGYSFAIYADAEDGGKLFWTDNSQYTGVPAPNKGLYFSKVGAYIEFPAIAGKALSEVIYTICNSGSGPDEELEITDTDSVMANHFKTDLEDGSGWAFELIDPAVNTTYRLTVTNRKNAQCAKMVLKYNAVP